MSTPVKLYNILFIHESYGKCDPVLCEAHCPGLAPISIPRMISNDKIPGIFLEPDTVA